MKEQNRFPVLFVAVVVALVLARLAWEHFTGGVQSHHPLRRADLPAISNWYGLITLPALALIVGMRARSHPASPVFLGLPKEILIPLLGAAIYGTALVTTLLVEAPTLRSMALAGLFLCALALPVYRAEYILGFVMSLTPAVGGVLPVAFAGVFALLSFVTRYLFRLLLAFVRGRDRADEDGAGPR